MYYDYEEKKNTSIYRKWCFPSCICNFFFLESVLKGIAYNEYFAKFAFVYRNLLIPLYIHEISSLLSYNINDTGGSRISGNRVHMYKRGGGGSLC